MRPVPRHAQPVVRVADKDELPRIVGIVIRTRQSLPESHLLVPHFQDLVVHTPDIVISPFVSADRSNAVLRELAVSRDDHHDIQAFSHSAESSAEFFLNP